MRLHSALVAALLALTTTAAAQSGRMVVGSGAMERDAWSGPTGGLPVHVVNRFGDVRLRHGGSEEQLEVAAVIQQLAIDGSKLALDIAVTEDAVEVSVVRIDYEGNRTTEIPNGDLAHADLAVMVPDGAPVRAETIAGLLESRGVRTDVELRTDRGAIRVGETRGAVSATTGSGSVEVTLVANATGAEQTLRSTTGSITVFTPATNSLDVTMATSGSFITDYSLRVEYDDASEPNKTARATVGKGGAPLSMTSRRGDLALRRVVSPNT
jgi:hypothetical protein